MCVITKAKKNCNCDIHLLTYHDLTKVVLNF